MAPPLPAAQLHFDQGVALVSDGRLAEAADQFQQAIAADPGFAAAHGQLGAALSALGRYGDAADAMQRHVAIAPDDPQALYDFAATLTRLGRFEEAVDALQRILSRHPDHADTWYSLGVACLSQGQLLDALAAFARAAEFDPAMAEAFNGIGATLVRMRRGTDAIPAFDRVLALDPDHALARAQRMFQLARQCDWTRLEADRPYVERLGCVGTPVTPFTMLAFEDCPERHRIRSERFAAQSFGAIAARPIERDSIAAERIAVGYFSADFHDHATMYLAAELFELHDAERFDVHFYSYGPPSEGSMRQRLLVNPDRFHDIDGQSDRAAADLARSHGIDIAIDLKGFTDANRLGIFAHRAAPVQIAFLGYPGTSGAPFIDYLVADPIVIPSEQRDAYSERLIVLPDCYQPNDRRRAIGPKRRRANEGLPDTGFVFCCFNNSYKISPVEFDWWMKLLERVEGSVLWLLTDLPETRINLRDAAAARGIDPDRLLFADKKPLPEHLARMALADLFLDTFNCNAHTTASDALWAGLPVLTRIGHGFAARVAASLLHAVGLDGLVTRSAEEYGALAEALATDPERLASIRATLAANRDTMPLFDSLRFTRHLEAGYELAFQRYRDEKAPADIQVPPITA